MGANNKKITGLRASKYMQKTSRSPHETITSLRASRSLGDDHGSSRSVKKMKTKLVKVRG